MAPKTIGDLVNGEIERTLEISHQSIINAAVNMSTNHPIPMEVYNVSRPERVNVRGPEGEYGQQFATGQTSSTASGYRGQEIPGRYSQSGATSAHEGQKGISSSGVNSSSSSKNSSNLFMASYTSNSLNTFGYGNSNSNTNGPTAEQQRGQSGAQRSSQGGPTPTSCLPRAEMKPYLEQYFLDDQFGKSGKMSNRSGGGGSRMIEEQESHRMSGPLEGLAASLQARVRATLNIKEEPEMLGRGQHGGHGGMKMPMHNMHNNHLNHQHPVIKQEGKNRRDICFQYKNGQ